MAIGIGGVAPVPAGLPQGILTKKKIGAVLLSGLWAVAPAMAQESGHTASARSVIGQSWVEAARYQCRFDRECLEDEACSDTEYELEVRLFGPSDADGPESNHFESIWPVPARLGDVSGDVELVSVSALDQDVQTVLGATDSASYLLSFGREGARYSLHMRDAPMAITYLGTCKEVE